MLPRPRAGAQAPDLPTAHSIRFSGGRENADATTANSQIAPQFPVTRQRRLVFSASFCFCPHIRVSSVPVLRREYPHPWLPAFMVRRPPTPYLNKRFPKFPWKKSPKFRPAIRLKLQLVLGGTRSCSSNKTTRDYPFSRRDSRALRNPQVPVPNPQAPFPTAQATFPTPQVALNLSASQFHRPLRRNNLRTKIENSSSNLSVPLPSI